MRFAEYITFGKDISEAASAGGFVKLLSLETIKIYVKAVNY